MGIKDLPGCLKPYIPGIYYKASEYKNSKNISVETKLNFRSIPLGAMKIKTVTYVLNNEYKLYVSYDYWLDAHSINLYYKEQRVVNKKQTVNVLYELLKTLNNDRSV